MASPSGDHSVERSHSKSPDSRIDAEDLIDDATAHLEKISDYKTYCKVSHWSLSRTDNVFATTGSDGHRSAICQRQPVTSRHGSVCAL